MHLFVVGHVRRCSDQLFNPAVSQFLAVKAFFIRSHGTEHKGMVAVGTGFKKKDGRKQSVLS